MWCLNYIYIIIVIGITVHGQRRGSDPIRIEFEVDEESPPGTRVGRIPTKPGFLYHFNEDLPYFTLDSISGDIRTSIRIDRETLKSDTFDLVILSSSPSYAIEIIIRIRDINDHVPTFPERVVRITFSESATPGTRIFLDPAIDLDVGSNGLVSTYKILSDNDERKFRLELSPNPSGEAPFLHLETVGVLDRESVSSYRLNISVSDSGQPPLTGHGTIDIVILDINDNPPIFDHSDYVVSLNESVPFGSRVLQVMATDTDEDENARISYYLADSESQQFGVDPETGTVTTIVSKLNCQQNCGGQRDSLNCPKSCVFTVYARDYGNPRQDGRTYVTVNLLDTNDHDPVIKFKYFPDSATGATVDENAQNGSVVAAISTVDLDEGLNGETIVDIISGNEFGHFRLEPSPLFQLVRVNGILDRERIPNYNISFSATDRGSPPRTSYSYLLITVKDVNDHVPVFETSEIEIPLRELVRVGSYVTSVGATDGDSGINALLHYSILSGNDLNWFGINNRTGLITTISELDREVSEIVTLKISARDSGPNPKWAQTQIKIRILDENDNSPQFQNSVINLTYPEDIPIGTILATLGATDPDFGSNGSISYFLHSGTDRTYPNKFSINSSSGVLTTKSLLDRESISTFDLIVIAKDHGSPPRSSTAMIHVNLTDVNDNEPIIYPLEYFLNLSRMTPTNTEILRVTATDKDDGANAQLTFGITSAQYPNFISIDPSTGMLKLRQSLERLRSAYMSLSVGVKDLGGRHAPAQAHIHIFVDMGTKSKAIRCEDLNLTVVEDMGIQNEVKPHRIGQLLTNEKRGLVNYSLIDGNPDSIFKIDNDGVVWVIRPLDREGLNDEVVRLIIGSSYTSGDQHDLGFGKCTITITVKDLNDFAPIFAPMIAPTTSQTIEIYENIAIGTEIIQVIATDKDKGQNGTVSYKISSNPNNLFHIHPHSGLITVNRSLEFDFRSLPTESEFSRVINLEVTATDGGSPPLSTTEIITVVVKDINNHTPVFGEGSYEISILESMEVNTRFYQLVATDLDFGPNGQVTYDLQDELRPSSDKFGIFPDGFLYVKSPLDREKEDFFGFNVLGIDFGNPRRSSVVSVIIHIIDQNDNPPKFTNSLFNFYILENEVIDSFVGKLSASDSDSGRNAELTFSIPSMQDVFMVDSRSGILRTLKSFDREELLRTTGKDYIVFDVQVEDGGSPGLRDTAQVRVHIQDVNDNAPIFTRSDFTIQISEGLPIGSKVSRVLATDADDGFNGDIVYYIPPNDTVSNWFRIEATTGQITVIKTLDRESIDVFNLKVVAQDLAEISSRRSFCKITVQILDENDNAPEFTQSEPYVEINESTEVGFELMTFSASDPDLSLNAQILFSIMDGNRADLFRIDPNTGSLYLNRPLDYEKQRIHVLNITASDSGNPKLSSSVQFQVKVQDANDNYPIFPNQAVIRRIQEGIALNSTILTLSAEDRDSGLNGKILYSIGDQEPSGDYFGIDSESGRIWTKNEIDREEIDNFRLTVVATDQAVSVSSRLSSEKLVTIIIEDVNDNSPRFTCLDSILLDAESLGSADIIRITVTDPDFESNGHVTLEMVTGDSSIFAFNRLSGWLSLKSLSKPLFGRHYVTIRATDEAISSKRRSSDLSLTVIGGKRTNEKLVFTSDMYKVQIRENEPPGVSILNIRASFPDNRDLSSEVEYYITNVTGSERVFQIDLTHGQLSTISPLDFENGISKYEIEISAIVISKMNQTLSVGRAIIEVELMDVNDTPPKFKETRKILKISENVPKNYEITTISALDPDTVGTMTYSLVKVTGQNGQNKFHLDSNSGNLKLAEPLDRELESEYTLYIRAFDGSQFSKSDMKIIIKVLDENDNAPVFRNNGIYSWDVAEDTPMGSRIGSLECTDPDIGSNAKLTYSSISDWGNDIFTLDPEMGIFRLTGRIDYEDVQHYVFAVEAADAGRPSLSSTGTVYINIKDVNDNTPVFDLMSYTAEIEENVAIGTSLIILGATDLDSGVNGQIEFRIESGNTDGKFDISKDNGTLYVVKQLDREIQSTYNLVISATDNGLSNQLSSHVQVTVTVRDINDGVPYFVSPNVTSIAENLQQNSLVLVVKANDPDEGRNGYIEYTLENERSTFTLGSVDGLLRVTQALDREIRTNYSLTIVAKDKGDPPMSSTQTLTVTVEDVNDNTPIFDPRQYFATIPENSSLGMIVLKVSATDSDEGQNARIRYDIIAGDSNHDFSIDDDTGIIRLARNINFERKETYSLTIRAEDNGKSVLYDTASVFITITNTNDNAPIFLHSPYFVQVRENSEEIPMVISRVMAFDADSGSNPQPIRYLLKDGGEKGTFSINSTSGEIRVHRRLDREIQSDYSLTVVAMDSGAPRLTGSGLIRITVQDVNDNSPQFEHAQYEVLINSTTPSGTLITHVRATDKDLGLNAEIKYALVFSTLPIVIDVSTGDIKLESKISNILPGTYHAQIQATDSSPLNPLSSYANLTIRTENPIKMGQNPKLNNEPRQVYVTIPDGSDSGTFVYGLSSNDVYYGSEIDLAGDDAAQFSFHSASAVVLTKFKLTGRVYTFEIRGDGFGPIRIRVELNPQKIFPVVRLRKNSYTFEETAKNITVALLAEAVQSARMNELQFEIGGGNIGNAFEINPTSGELRISPIGLDYELTPTFDLWILVSLAPKPNLKTAVLLHVNVTDVNDTEPLFERSLYDMSILEEEVPPKKVGSVQASDRDSGVNGEFKYRLNAQTQNTYGHLFTVDPLTGELRTKSKLDRESQAKYSLIIEALDNGHPSLTGSTIVHVTVEDKNDNPPRFTRLFSANVTEHAPLGAFVIQVTSVDKDIGANANSTYIFPNVAESLPFQIDSVSGNITVRGILDREIQEEYLIPVAAVDGSWRAETLVTITVQDINDNAPEFEHALYSFRIPEGKESNTLIGSVLASDRDRKGPNSAIIYSLKYPSDLFSVDPLTGQLFSKIPLKYQSAKRNLPENEHNLILLASDLGRPPLTSETSVRINVVDENTNPPIFSKAHYQSAALESSEIGHNIIRIVAIASEDVGLNAETEYFVLPSNGSEFFDVEKETGWIRIHSELIGQKGKHFELGLRATDKGIPALSADVNLTLIVTGVNAHAPIFKLSNYRAIVPENEIVGTPIITVSATDADEGLNGIIRYQILSGNNRENFEIDENTGDVKIAKTLDYETIKEYNLEIGALDEGFEPKSASVPLSILLTDVNDNPPVFSRRNFIGSIRENSDPGTHIITLTATDVDSPKYAQIQFAIVGGTGQPYFSINETSGLIVSKTTFDYEEESKYSIEVVASNPDSELFGTTRVDIEILGVNEFKPRFTRRIYAFIVSESAGIGTIVGQVEATDGDEGPDGLVNYYFLGSRSQQGLAVHVTSGVITVTQRLDRESQSHVVLSVVAKNGGPIRGGDIDEAQVVITIQDGNDPPTFTKDVYTVQIPEDILPGSKVITVEANDSDIRPTNSRFSYDILSGNDNVTFKIDPTTGTIVTVLKLDRETVSAHVLKIGAIDAGDPPQTGTTTVSIIVTDVNDNGPQLDTTSRQISILENQPPGTRITTLRPTDPDAPPNGGPFTFKLLTPEFVNVDPRSGVVTSLVTFDREVISSFTFNVQIQDSGRPTMKSTIEVIVDVLDVNDNPSTPRDVRVTLSTFEHRIPSETIAYLEPNDPDTNGNFNCRFANNANENFAFRRNCALHLSQIPQANSQALKIVSSDGKYSDVTSTATIDYVNYDTGDLQAALILRISETTPETLLQKNYAKLLSLLRQILPSKPLVIGLKNVAGISNSTDLILSTRNRESTTKTLEGHVGALEGILGHLVQVDWSPCHEAPCQNEAIGCSYDLTVTTNQSLVQTRNFILSFPLVEIKLKCSCAKDYEGLQCQYRKEPCDPNPCQGNGICRRADHDYYCACPVGRSGLRCEDIQNPCDPNPCGNGGTCNSDPSSPNAYFCLCRPGFLGRFCAVSTIDACSPNPCQNGGSCHFGQTSIICKCTGAYHGKYCDSAGLGFRSGSYMTFPPLDPTSHDMSITFSTSQAEALLFYNYGDPIGGRSDFFALELRNGKPHVGFGGSRTAVSNLMLNRIVNDGHWHRISTNRNGKLVTLTLSSCDKDGNCRECPASNSTCSANEIGQTGTLHFNGNPLFVGGLKSVTPLLERLGQVYGDDFVGCVHSLDIKGKLFNVSNPLESRGIRDTCTRVGNSCLTSNKCGTLECIDKWDSALCRCNSGLLATNCEDVMTSFTVGSDGYITFTIKETFRRQQLLRNLRRKEKESLSINRLIEDEPVTVSFNFRTTRPSGVLFYARTNTEYTLLRMDEGELSYVSKIEHNHPINMTLRNLALTDGSWHSVQLMRRSHVFSVHVDGEHVGDELNTVSSHNFLDPYLTNLSLGGIPFSQNNELNELPSFEGCLANFSLNGIFQSLNGTGILLVANPVGSQVSAGCAIPFGVSLPPDPLSIGVTLVVIFFFILLVAILVSFLVVRLRKTEKTPLPASSNPHPPQSARPLGGKDISSSQVDIPRHPDRSGFVRNPKKKSDLPSGLAAVGYQTPDIIERSNPPGSHHLHNSNPHQPDSLRKGIISMEPNTSEYNPEHYDLENASSIAPSDIDIVYHYKGFRNRPKSSPFGTRHQHGFGALAGGNLRQSPNNVLKNTPLARLSPSSELSHQTGPRILTLRDISGKPYQNALLHSSKDAMSQSEQSLDLSQSSGQSSVLHPSSVSQTGKKRRRKGHGRQLPENGRRSPTIGLTAEEIERLNARHKINSSLLSTMDDADSSSESARGGGGTKNVVTAPIQSQNRSYPPQTTSEEEDQESGNDSFMCSDFEFPQQHRRPPTGGTDFSRPYPTIRNTENDGAAGGSFRGSLSTLVASDDENGIRGFRNGGTNEGWNGSRGNWSVPPGGSISNETHTGMSPNSNPMVSYSGTHYPHVQSRPSEEYV